MAVTKIHGARQITDDTITNAQIKSDAAIALSKLAEPVIQADGGQAFTADQPMGGFKITGLGAPSSANDAARLADVQAAQTGLDVKQSVRAATTAAGTLATSFENGDTIDGVVLATGNRILIKNQAAPEENGIYTVNASGAPTRATDADANAEVTAGLFVFVEEGTTNADTGWVLTTDGAIVVDTTGLVFSQFTGAGTISAGAGLTKTGDTVDVVAADNTLTVNADSVQVKLDPAGAITVDTDGISVAPGTGLEISSNTVRIAAAAAGDGLTGGGASALAVNPGEGIEIVSDAVRVKLDGSSLSRGAGGLKVNAAKFITRETPSGSVNGSNTSFVLAATPIAGTESVFLNGLLQEPGAGNDYTISGDTITYLAAPLTGDKLRVSYIVA